MIFLTLKKKTVRLDTMNIQNNKKIIFNKSSLLHLKAELIKKQEEVLEKKKQPHNRIENFKPPPAKTSEKSDKNEKTYKKTFKDNLKEVDTEELEACRKSKAALEKKAELYEHLSDSAGDSQLAGRFLVDFKTKKEDVVKEIGNSVQNDRASFENDELKDGHIYDDDTDADEWTEFTDCLGRTRKCHKSDLELYIKKDRELKKIMLKDEEGENVEEVETQEPKKEKPLLVQKTNDYLQSLREKWEIKEKELLGKENDIHYQDLLFDEARIHGVGYYSFSTNENERRQQMEELKRQREETLQAQKQAEEARKKREEIIAARVKAARARQRMKEGLPPEDSTENEKDFTTCLLEFLTQQKNEADAKAKEEERKKKEELEKERQKLREAYIREWDLGKEGVDEKVKRFREMTQEEYVEQQRSKRIDEFAPPQASSSRVSDYTFDNTGRMIGNSGKPKTWSEVRPKPKTPPPPLITGFEEQKGLYFSTTNQHTERPKSPPLRRDLKYKNFVKQETVPIVNELSDEEDITKEEQNRNRIAEKKISEGVEVAPPPTYDYYGPVPKRVKQQDPFQSDINEAYAQGMKSLETKPSNRQISEKYDFIL